MAEINADLLKKILIVTFAIIIMIILAAALINYLSKGKVEVSITSIPTGAELKLGGRSYKTPATIKDVKEGNHTISIIHKGYLERKEKITVFPGGENTFSFRLYTDNISPGAVLSDLLKVENQKDPVEDLIRLTPFESKHFLVEYKRVAGQLRFVVTLFAQEQTTEKKTVYEKQLAQYKKEAIDWLEKQEVQASKLDILWEPRVAIGL